MGQHRGQGLHKCGVILLLRDAWVKNHSSFMGAWGWGEYEAESRGGQAWCWARVGKNTALFLPHKLSAEGPGEDRDPRMKGPGLGVQTGESRASSGALVSDYSPLDLCARVWWGGSCPRGCQGVCHHLWWEMNNHTRVFNQELDALVECQMSFINGVLH